MKQFKSTFLLTSMGEYNNKQYVIPRKFETRVMVYCKSKVADALLNWRQYYNQIDLEMKRYNGYGLPATYVLETDPNEWDYFDIFVVGWVWAHTAYNGKTTPRIAHRGKWYSGTSLRLVDRIYQLEGDSAQIVTMSMRLLMHFTGSHSMRPVRFSIPECGRKNGVDQISGRV